MKKITVILSIFSLAFFTQCDILEGVAQEVVNTGGSDGATKPSLTNDEVIKGLKEALKIGIQNGAGLASMENGFFGNAAIKLPFPEDANKLKDKAIEWGLQGKVDEITLTLNRAAEEASKKASPIFVDAITNMSIADGFEILRGSDSAATSYLMRTTTVPLVNAFKPVVHNAIETVKLTSMWNPIATRYNNWAPLFGREQVNADLDDYVTNKGVEGLFYMIKQEEKKIRLDPAARVTDILKKVFGSVLK